MILLIILLTMSWEDALEPKDCTGVSGGVASINDIVAIKKLTQPPELEGVIVGKAMYDGRLSQHNIVNLLT